MVVAMVDNRAVKRAKRSSRITADLYDLLTFPGDAAGEGAAKPFRDEVRNFLSSHARVTFPSSSLFSSLVSWQILFRVGDLTDGPDFSSRVVALDVLEEDVTRSARSVYCDQCQVVGESTYPSPIGRRPRK